MLYSCFLKVLFTLSKSGLDSAHKRHLCIDAFQVKSKTLWPIFVQSAFTVDWFLCHNKEIKVIIRIARIALFHNITRECDAHHILSANVVSVWATICWVALWEGIACCDEYGTG